MLSTEDKLALIRKHKVTDSIISSLERDFVKVASIRDLNQRKSAMDLLSLKMDIVRIKDNFVSDLKRELEMDKMITDMNSGLSSAFSNLKTGLFGDDDTTNARK